jgi:hypothetical protein
MEKKEEHEKGNKRERKKRMKTTYLGAKSSSAWKDEERDFHACCSQVDSMMCEI